jgi:Eco29kI restriction endonuclease
MVSKDTTMSKRTLRDRLGEHRRKISGRQNISISDMQCRYLTFASEWWVFAAEFALITHYAPEWNASGFGSKTPGQWASGHKTCEPLEYEVPQEVKFTRACCRLTGINA